MKKNSEHFYFFRFFGIFVVDCKIFVKLSSIFSAFISLASLRSLGSDLVLFKILIFRGDILKNVCKKIPSFLASIFPCIPSSQILNLKKIGQKSRFLYEKCSYKVPQWLDRQIIFLHIIFITYM